MKTREEQIRNITWLGMAINAVLTAFKLLAGVLGKSSTMIADGVHSLSDFISDIIILVFLKIADRRGDKDHKKFETIATCLLSIILIVVAAEILSHGIEKARAVLGGEDVEAPTMIALIAAAVSIAVKEFCYQITARVGKRINSPAVITNAWHHRSDALSSVGSLAGIGGAIWLGKRWVILDPLMGCVIAIVIFVVAIKGIVAVYKFNSQRNNE